MSRSRVRHRPIRNIDAHRYDTLDRNNRGALEMPEASRFFGIVIAIYYNDHEPAHFHARYGDREARIDILTGATLSGALPPRAMRLVQEWSALHRGELLEDWARARMRKPLQRIAPLE